MRPARDKVARTQVHTYSIAIDITIPWLDATRNIICLQMSEDTLDDATIELDKDMNKVAGSEDLSHECELNVEPWNIRASEKLTTDNVLSIDCGKRRARPFTLNKPHDNESILKTIGKSLNREIFR